LGTPQLQTFTPSCHACASHETPVVFLFAVFLLKDFKTQIKNTLTWAIPAVVICLLYYKIALPAISEISDVKIPFFHSLNRHDMAFIHQTPLSSFKALVNIHHFLADHSLWVHT